MIWRRKQTYDYAISLGDSCQPAWQLAKNGLRDKSYPLDWVSTKCVDSLCALLESGFQDFFEKPFLEPQISGPKEKVFFRNSKYGFIYRHEFKTLREFDEDFEEMQEVYRRRVARFKERLRSEASVLLVRLHINREEAEKIVSTLTGTFPNLDFTLLALDQTEEIRKDWGIPRVLNRHIKCAPRNDAINRKFDGNWRKVLREFDIRKGAPSPWKESDPSERSLYSVEE